MSTHVHYDERQVEQIVAKRMARMLARINNPGAKGAEARFNVALFRPFMMALVAENNRGTSLGDIELAVASALSNIMTTWSSTVADSDDPDVVIPHFNSMAVLVDDFTTRALQIAGQDPDTHVTEIHAQQAGRG